MISVCIPNHNWDVRSLVKSLLRSADKAGTQIEVLVGDDGSTEFLNENSELLRMDAVHYFHHKENLGRSGNRNFLAAKARFDSLLFLDGDAELPSDKFISKYGKKSAEFDVLCGGTKYGKRPDESRQLRWEYGKEREQRIPFVRNRDPYKGFSSFNFLVKSEVFKQLRFDERLTQYGHEDTLFGMALRNKGFSIRHIDAPAIHLGLDTNEVFMDKTRTAIENLVELEKVYPKIADEVGLLKLHNQLEKAGLGIVLGIASGLLANFLGRLLESGMPFLPVFDLYKLLYLSKLKDSPE